MDHHLMFSNLKFVDVQFSVTVDNDVNCLVTLRGISRDDSRAKKMFFDTSMFDIQSENKNYSICQFLSLYCIYFNYIIENEWT